MITIGNVYHGPELRGSAIQRATTALAKAAADQRGAFEFGTAPAINVVFHVAGSFGEPDWEWIRYGKYSKKQLMLLIEIAVHADIIKGDDPVAFGIESLHGANAMAYEHFRMQGPKYPLAEAEALVREIGVQVKAGLDK